MAKIFTIYFFFLNFSQFPVFSTLMMAPSFFNSPKRRFTVASDEPTIAAYLA